MFHSFFLFFSTGDKTRDNIHRLLIFAYKIIEYLHIFIYSSRASYCLTITKEMEKLANLTETDIKNGVLNHMLANAGISNVQDYVEQFHQDTENLIIEQIEHPDPDKTYDDDQIAPPADIQSWITGLRLRLDDPVKPLLPEQQQQQQPTDLKSWMQRMAPNSSHSSTLTTPSETTTTATDNDAPVTGNLGSWLNDWSKNLAEQPPPASLDNWLKGLVPPNMNEPIGKTNSSKGRLNSYLNAAQDVLSKNGYNVSNEVALPTNVKNKTGMFGNVKHMYFLVSFLVLFSSLHLDILFLLFYLVENIR
jgi:hypothetical protein